MTEKQNEENLSEFVRKYKWLIRPCKDYRKEVAECRSFRSRFQQYFVDGSFTDCSPLLHNSHNCLKCTDNFNEHACREIIKNESVRKLKRIEDHKKNDVWERRTEPPENWNSPLPAWFYENKKQSFFFESKEEFINHMENTEPPVHSYCTIL